MFLEETFKPLEIEKYDEIPKKDQQYGTISKETIKDIKKAGLNIVKIPTNKSKIPQREVMENNIIPRHPGRVIFNGQSNSGKSTLIVNLLIRPEFYGKRERPKNGKPTEDSILSGDKYKHYFDEIYLFSPTGTIDDLAAVIDIPKENKFDRIDTKKIDEILEKQKTAVENKSIEKAPRVLIILDDIQTNQKFLNSDGISQMFLMGRHYGVSIWLSSQSWMKTPRSLRLQVSNIFFFPSNASEISRLSDEFTPPGYTKKEFENIIKFATDEPYNFLHINMNEPAKTRNRRNLEDVLELVK